MLAILGLPQHLVFFTEKEEEEEVPVNQRKDPFNISNDEYYNPRVANDTALRTNVGGNIAQLSVIPALFYQSMCVAYNVCLQLIATR